MSRTELERLARIRMQVTGETLERAMAVLKGQAAEPDPEASHAPESDRTLPDVAPEAPEPGFTPTLAAAPTPAPDPAPATDGEGDGDGTGDGDGDRDGDGDGDGNGGAEPADLPDVGEAPPQRRPHLRGL